jgi:hypothetical protein
MAIQLPKFVQRVVSVLSTNDDQTDLDNFLSVATLVLVTKLVVPMITAVLVIPQIVVIPVSAGLLAVVVRHLSK